MDGQAVQAPAPHGQKRHAEDDLKSEQRLAKRFDLLNLGQLNGCLLYCFACGLTLHAEQNGKLYVPVPQPLMTHPPPHDTCKDSMHIDDTKHRVYIHSLDDELSELQSDEEKMVFLPEIEQKLAKIPRLVLTSDMHPSASNQMVLYSVPSSLTVPEEQDRVRTAIIESRARARDKQIQNAQVKQVTHTSNGSVNGVTQVSQTNGHHYQNQPKDTEEYGDAMDLG